MSAVGAGAVLDAIARMRRAERQMARTRVSRRDVRLSHTRHSDVPDRLPYPCYFLCGRCGWLEDGRQADPLRTEPGQASEPGPCPSCGAKGWVELRKQSTAIAYREAEALDLALLAGRARRMGVWLGGVLSVAVLARLVFEIPMLPRLVGVPALLGLGLVTWWATGMAIAGLVRRTRPGRARPRRWRRPLPRPESEVLADEPEGRVVEGTVEGEAVLQTPLGREPCVAWSVQVWSDQGLLLDEQHQAALRVHGVTVPRDSVALDLVPRRVAPLRGDDEPLARFLGRRGLSPHDSSLRIYEAHLVPGVPVTLHRTNARPHAHVILSQAPRALAS